MKKRTYYKKPEKHNAMKQYFEGYSKVEVLSKNGMNVKEKLVYTEPYYKQDISTKRWILQKIIVAACVALTLFFFTCASAIRQETEVKIVLVPVSVSLIAMVMVASYTIVYIMCRRLMTGYTYKNITIRFHRWLKTAVISLAFASAFNLLYLLGSEAAEFNILKASTFYLLGSLTLGSVALIEKKTKYIRQEKTKRVV